MKNDGLKALAKLHANRREIKAKLNAYESGDFEKFISMDSRLSWGRDQGWDMYGREPLGFNLVEVRYNALKFQYETGIDIINNYDKL